jgi:hypothetical protein
MKLTFRTVSILSAFVFLSLALTGMFASNVLPSAWGVAFSYPVGLMCRRGAALYAGSEVMFLGARNSEPTPARSALIAGSVVSCLILATLGIFEFAKGHAGNGILVGVLIEITLTLAFLSVARDRKASHGKPK